MHASGRMVVKMGWFEAVHSDFSEILKRDGFPKFQITIIIEIWPNTHPLIIQQSSVFVLIQVKSTT